MDYKLELVILPVTDVERSKTFYAEQLGFAVDADNQAGSMRVCQLTPPGSACSITIGPVVLDAPPSVPARLQLVVDDIVAAHAELAANGVQLSDVVHFEDGVQKPGKGERFNSFVFFDDPDGNGWAVQEA